MSDILTLPHDAGRPGSLHAGWDYVITGPGEAAAVRCRVCGEVMAAYRGVVGPTSWAHARAIGAGGAKGRLHDAFACDFSGEPWHRQALALKLEALKTPSKQVERLLLEKAERVVRTRAATKEVFGPLLRT
jgi:hypothetical protein